jgi:hypothetical protein
MKKKYRLKRWVKNYIAGFLVSIGFIVLMLLIIDVYSIRIEKIENGSMILVNHNGGDR